MVGNDNGGANIGDLFRYVPFNSGNDGSQKREKKTVEPVIKFLKNLFTSGRKKEGRKIEWRKEHKVSHNIVYPEGDSDGEILNRF
jgi:hypothetical protein